ncbi:MAG: metallophosphoesterase family protein [Polyangiales bacterium]
MTRRTFAIGDIHGESAALDRLLSRMPELTSDDTLIFIGDYLDRGPDAKGVVERVRAVQRDSPAKVVVLRGNHEDKWIQCYDDPDIGFLLPGGNGCGATFRSYTGATPLKPGEAVVGEEFVRLLDVRAWLPTEVLAWMNTLAFWYEDEHALYVHAGLQSAEGAWKHPRDSNHVHLMWAREPAFFKRYKGKRCVFGHTPVSDLPDVPSEAPSPFEDPREVWCRGDLIGIDTGSGKGGTLSAIELPAFKVYDAR